MRSQNLIVLALVVIALVALAIIFFTMALGEAQSELMLREPTPLQNQIAARESMRQDGGFASWPVVIVLTLVLITLAYLSIGDRTTKLLRAWKSARKPGRSQPQALPVQYADIQEIPTAPRLPPAPQAPQLPQLPPGEQDWSQNQ